MTAPEDKVLVRVSHRFSASAERVYDAFLDPSKAAKFLFATATGQVVRCEIDARIGGRFTIVDRRDGEDVAHTGEYQALQRPKRIVFSLAVPKYGADHSTVRIEIAPRGRGCELTLTHEIDRKYAEQQGRTRSGWANILEIAAELLAEGPETCGAGIAQHATIPASIGRVFAAMADTFELHRKLLQPADELSRQEDAVYRELATSWRDIAERVRAVSERMLGQRELPMAAHDESAWGPDNLAAFERFVSAQASLLMRLRIAAERDGKMLASMQSG